MLNFYWHWLITGKNYFQRCNMNVFIVVNNASNFSLTWELKSRYYLVLEGTPETLVQGVPSALSEVYNRTMNGQMSDASIHDEDQSEPTVATLSSEATGEMDVSSLDDKSQAETHVEKRGKQNYTFQIIFFLNLEKENVEKTEEDNHSHLEIFVALFMNYSK